MKKETHWSKLKRTDPIKFEQYKQERYEYNRKKFPNCSLEWYHKTKNNPKTIISLLLKLAKSRAKQRKIEFTLTRDDIIIPEYCPVFGIKFDKSNKHTSPSLDRIDPAKGYVKENVRVISFLANAMKWDSSREQRIKFAEWVLAGEKC